jgi:hypothetical protein
MADIKLDYVNSFYDARGKLRHQFRRKGHKRVTIKGRPGSLEFMDAYHALLEQTGGPLSVADIGASRTKAGTIDALIVGYLKHDAFKKGLAQATQAMRRPILDHFREFMTPSGRRYGENRLATIQPKNITAVLEGKTPNAQRNWLKALRHLIAFAIAQGECSVDPSADVRPLRGIKSMGHMTWKPPQIVQYRVHHALGTTARLALLADRTCKLSPDGWGRRAVEAYREFKADRIIAERNFGGAMCEHVIRSIDPNVPYREVTASRGKVARAEPAAALYEQGKIKHAHRMPELEDQFLAMTGNGFVGDGSPDRLDAAVWCLFELMGAPEPGIIEWSRLEALKATAPRANPSDTSTFTVTLKSPAGISDVHLMSGRAVPVPPDRLVKMTVEDSKPLLAIGWTTQNNLENR